MKIIKQKDHNTLILAAKTTSTEAERTTWSSIWVEELLTNYEIEFLIIDKDIS